MELIDGYIHCGLSKYEPIEQVRRVMRAAGVERAVLVQHLGEFDNSYIGGIVASDPERFAGVCLLNHKAADCVDLLSRLARSGHFKGVRIPTEAFSTAPHILHAAAELGLIIVLYAPASITDFIKPLLEFLEARPSVRLVLTHLGSPDASEGPDYTRYRQVFLLARFPGVYYQVSGMKMACPYPHEPFHPLIGDAAEQFGILRLYWGSNYPVVGDEKDYIKDLRLLLDGQLPVPDEAIPMLAGKNARRLWFAD